MNHKNLCAVGTRFHKLVVLGQPFRVRAGKSMWKKVKQFCVCQCDCGGFVACSLNDLVANKMKSCGCWRVHIAVTMGHKNLRHGQVKTRLYDLWHGMKLRCHTKSTPSYPSYGGRGIRVCDEWNESFEAYRDWALANGFADGLQIDRINNDGNYEPDNCRWVTCQVNQNNRRSNVNVTYAEETKSIGDWARDGRCAVTRLTLWRRYQRSGWPFGKALTTPPIPRGADRVNFRVELLSQ